MLKRFSQNSKCFDEDLSGAMAYMASGLTFLQLTVNFSLRLTEIRITIVLKGKTINIHCLKNLKFIRSCKA